MQSARLDTYEKMKEEVESYVINSETQEAEVHGVMDGYKGGPKGDPKELKSQAQMKNSKVLFWHSIYESPTRLEALN